MLDDAGFRIFEDIILKSQTNVFGKEIVMNCKFHPEAEAVTTCAVCGAWMCSACDAGAFYVNDGKPLCLDCSLKEAEEQLETRKMAQKFYWSSVIIASIFWIAGLVLGDKVHAAFYLLMLIAAIGVARGSLFKSDGEGLFGIIKTVFWVTLFLPLVFIFILISGKWEKIKTKRKVKKIKAALDNANR